MNSTFEFNITQPQQQALYFLNAGVAALKSKNNVRALDFFKRALDLSPNNKYGHLGLAFAYYAIFTVSKNERKPNTLKKIYISCAKYLARVLNVDPSDKTADTFLSHCFKKLKNEYNYVVDRASLLDHQKEQLREPSKGSAFLNQIEMLDNFFASYIKPMVTSKRTRAKEIHNEKKHKENRDDYAKAMTYVDKVSLKISQLDQYKNSTLIAEYQSMWETIKEHIESDNFKSALPLLEVLDNNLNMFIAYEKTKSRPSFIFKPKLPACQESTPEKMTYKDAVISALNNKK